MNQNFYFVIKILIYSCTRRTKMIHQYTNKITKCLWLNFDIMSKLYSKHGMA